MKRLLFVFALLLILCLPVLAQDATAEATVEAGQVTVIDGAGSGDTNITVESPETPAAPVDSAISNILVYVPMGLLVVVFIVVLYNQNAVMKIVAPLVPTSSLAEIAKAITPTVADLVLNNVASKLPTEIDDKALIEALRQRGYVVTGAVGAYHTEPAPDTTITTTTTTSGGYVETATSPMP